MTIPQKKDTTDGRMDTIGKLWTILNELFAINQQICAVPHITPEINPGNVASG